MDNTENKVPEGAEPQAAPVEVDESGNPVVKPEGQASEAPVTDAPAA